MELPPTNVPSENPLMLSRYRFPSAPIILSALSLLLCLTICAQNIEPAAGQSEPLLTSSVFEWDKLPVKKTATGERREIVEGRTPTLAQFRSHITTLDPGTSWGSLDKHTDEEVVIVKDGTLEYEINGHLQKAGPGAVILLVAGETHRSRNASATTPVTYFVFHAVTAEAKAAATLAAPTPKT